MAGITRTASAEWQGTGKEGKGTLTTQSGVLSTTPYGFNTRFGDTKGTNPEELIAAAHAGCFSMALAFALTAGGLHADAASPRRRPSPSSPRAGLQDLEVGAEARGHRARHLARAVPEDRRRRQGRLPRVQGAERRDHARLAAGLKDQRAQAHGSWKMQKRKLGNSGLRDRAADVRRQRLRLDGRRGDVVQAARRASSTPASTPSTRPTSIRAGCRATRAASPRRSSATGSRRAAAATRSSSPPRSAWRCRARRRACAQAYILPRVEALAEAPADRLHRPLPVAHRRQGDAARGDARRLPDAHRAGQGARHRRLQLRRRRGWPKRSRPSAAEKLPRYESPAAALQPLRPRRLREGRWSRCALKEDVGVIPYYALASGFLTGKYRSEADFGKSPRGGARAEHLNERGLRILAALDEVAARAQRQARRRSRWPG